MEVDYEISPQEDRSRAQPITARMVTYLRTLIETGELQPGMQIPPLCELARGLNIDRRRLRAGIAFLRMIGVLKICPGSGSYVLFGTQNLLFNSASMSGRQQRTFASQLLDACNLIEGAMASRAAERASARHVADLAEEVAGMYACLNDHRAYALHHIGFRRVIAQASGNSVLDEILELLTISLSNDQPWPAKPSRYLRKSAEMHRDIYRAIRSHNPIEAKELMEQSIQGVVFGNRRANSRRLPGRTAADMTGRKSTPERRVS